MSDTDTTGIALFIQGVRKVSWFQTGNNKDHDKELEMVGKGAIAFGMPLAALWGIKNWESGWG